MVTPVKFITKVTTYNDIRDMVQTGLRLFPVVDSKSETAEDSREDELNSITDSQILIGTVSRRYLTVLLNGKIGDQERKAEAERRVRRAIETIDNHFRDSEKEVLDELFTVNHNSFPVVRRSEKSVFWNWFWINAEEEVRHRNTAGTSDRTNLSSGTKEVSF